MLITYIYIDVLFHVSFLLPSLSPLLLSLSASQGKGQPAKFPTECFYMTSACHHLALGPALRRYKQGMREIHQLRQVSTFLFILSIILTFSFLLAHTCIVCAISF